jgi:ADP-ribose pyrophosphatase YjhB (NUDIX family)
MKEEFNNCPLCGTSLEKGFIEGKDRKFCPGCNFVDYKNPLPVALAIPVRDKRFLMIKRGIAPRKGAWGFPSGFIESGETAEEACLRELKEETGLSGKIVKLVGIHRIEDKEVHGDMLVVMYLVAVDGEGDPTPGNDEEDARFFDVEDMPAFYVGRFRHLIDEIQN